MKKCSRCYIRASGVWLVSDAQGGHIELLCAVHGFRLAETLVKSFTNPVAKPPTNWKLDYAAERYMKAYRKRNAKPNKVWRDPKWLTKDQTTP